MEAQSFIGQICYPSRQVPLESKERKDPWLIIRCWQRTPITDCNHSSASGTLATVYPVCAEKQG